eukprot:403367650
MPQLTTKHSNQKSKSSKSPTQAGTNIYKENMQNQQYQQMPQPYNSFKGSQQLHNGYSGNQQKMSHNSGGTIQQQLLQQQQYQQQQGYYNSMQSMPLLSNGNIYSPQQQISSMNPMSSLMEKEIPRQSNLAQQDLFGQYSSMGQISTAVTMNQKTLLTNQQQIQQYSSCMPSNLQSNMNQASYIPQAYQIDASIPQNQMNPNFSYCGNPSYIQQQYASSIVPSSHQRFVVPQQLPLNMAKELNEKALKSYRYYMKKGSSQDQNHLFAFFYLSITQKGSNCSYFQQMELLRKKLKPFQVHFTNYNSTQHSSRGNQPQLLIVADEVFKMDNKTLSQLVKHSIPNTLKESNLLNCKNQGRFTSPLNRETQQYHGLRHNIEAALVDNGKRYIGKREQQENLLEVMNRQEKFRQKEAWNFTQYVVQAHVFNDAVEQSSQTVYEYLKRNPHNIISFSMCDKIANYWLSQRVDYHIEKGLRFTHDGQPCQNGGRSISYQNVISMQSTMKKAFFKEARQSVFAITAQKPGTLTSSQMSGGMLIKNNQFAQEFHFFSQNCPNQMQVLKGFFGTRINVGKYDYPHFNPEAPLGTSLFPLLNERHYAMENIEYFKDKHIKDVEQLRKKKTLEEKNQAIEEPKPGANHLFCAICREGFKDYLQHVFSRQHKDSLNKGDNNWLFREIDIAITEIDFVSMRKEKEFQKHLQKAKLERMMLEMQKQQELIINPEDKERSSMIDCTVKNDMSSGSKLTTSTADSDHFINAQNRQSTEFSSNLQFANSNKEQFQITGSSIMDELKNPLIIDIDDEDLADIQFNDDLAFHQQQQELKENALTGQKRHQPDNLDLDFLQSKIINQLQQQQQQQYANNNYVSNNRISVASVEEIQNPQTSQQTNEGLGRLSQNGMSTRKRRRI